jgi:hypothetical protein
VTILMADKANREVQLAMAPDVDSFPDSPHLCPNRGDVAPDMVFCERCMFDDACLRARLHALQFFAKQRASSKATESSTISLHTPRSFDDKCLYESSLLAQEGKEGVPALW